jgi:hypothetical protein
MPTREIALQVLLVQPDHRFNKMNQAATRAFGFADSAVTQRKDQLSEQAPTPFDAVTTPFKGAIYGDPHQLRAVVRSGLFDLAGTPAASGGCDAVDPSTGDMLDEFARICILDRADGIGEEEICWFDSAAGSN